MEKLKREIRKVGNKYVQNYCGSKPEKRGGQDNYLREVRNRAGKRGKKDASGGSRRPGEHGGKPGNPGAGRTGRYLSQYHGENHQ